MNTLCTWINYKELKKCCTSYTMASQVLFSRVVSSCLPLAVPTQLDRIDEFGNGKVLIFSKKPRRFLPWRKQDLNFTGWSLASLLEETSAKDVQIAAATSLEFDSSKKAPKVTVDLTTEVSLKDSLVKLDPELKTDRQSQLTITANFGKVTHISTDLLYSISSKKLQVKLDHPTIQEAIATGGTLFVITTAYMADKCHVQVALGDVQSQVVSLDKPTPIAFLLLKLSIDSKGQLSPRFNSGLLSMLENCDRPSLTKVPYEYQTSHPPEAVDPTKLILKKVQSQESLEFSGWVVVDVFSPEQRAKTDNQPEEPSLPSVSEEPEQNKESTSPTSGEEGSKVTSSGDQPPTESPIVETVQVEETANLASTPVVEETVQVEETTNLASTPVVEETVQVKEVDNLYSPPMKEEGVSVRFVLPDPNDIPQLDEHYIYSLKDFQPFESTTYDGIFGEVQQWVKPLVSNKALHTAYLTYTNPPRTAEKLKKISEDLQKYGNALRMRKPLPDNTHPPLKPVISALSSEWAVKVDEVSSVVVVSEAFMEFPQHIVKRAKELPQEKRQILVDFIRSTPYGFDKHVYMDEGPFNDPDLYPIMTRMGFSIPAHTKKLTLEAGYDENEDKLAAGLILLLATQVN